MAAVLAVVLVLYTTAAFWVPGTRSTVPQIAIVGWQMGSSLMYPTTEECDMRRNCSHSQFSLDLIRINRLFNKPSTRFVLLLDSDALEARPYYKQVLQRAKVEVHDSKKYKSPGSRAYAYNTLHINYGLRGAGCQMFSRFCQMADVAKEVGLERILAIDSDVGLFDDVQKVFAPFEEDVVTPCPSCSQVSLWSAKALDMLCDSMIKFFALPPSEIFRLLLKYNAFKAAAGDTPAMEHLTDMHFMKMFLEEKFGGHNLSWIDLAASAEPSPRIPHPGIWLAARSATWASPDMMTPEGFRETPNKDPFCKVFDDIFAFKPSAISKMPLPTHRASGVTFPILHFNGKCKVNVVGKMYQSTYDKLFDQAYPANSSSAVLR